MTAPLRAVVVGASSGSLLEVDELVNVVDTVVRGGSSMSVPSVTVTPRPAGLPQP